MAQPLPLSYNWRTPLVFATAALVVLLGILIRGRAVGWWSAALLLLLCWAGYCLVVWSRTRAYLLAEGPVLTIRRWRSYQRIEGPEVRAVKEVTTPSGLFTIRFSVSSNKGRFNGGRGIEGIGVPPHEIVPMKAEDLRKNEDTQVKRAVELLQRGFPKGVVEYGGR